MAFWTGEREDQFRALAAAGKTAREIALELGCSRSTVHDRARLLDLVLPTPADPETDRDGKPKSLKLGDEVRLTPGKGCKRNKNDAADAEEASGDRLCASCCVGSLTLRTNHSTINKGLVVVVRSLPDTSC